jgi:Family of unknown function (DUF5990)
MTVNIKVKIRLQQPVTGVMYGLQKGTGTNYQTIQQQLAADADLNFEMEIGIRGDPLKDAVPSFSGLFVHGPKSAQFIYLDIGASAGQPGSVWRRRLKIPLVSISWEMITKLTGDDLSYLFTDVPGKAKDGTPNCATVKPFSGWRLK